MFERPSPISEADGHALERRNGHSADTSSADPHYRPAQFTPSQGAAELGRSTTGASSCSTSSGGPFPPAPNRSWDRFDTWRTPVTPSELTNNFPINPAHPIGHPSSNSTIQAATRLPQPAAPAGMRTEEYPRRRPALTHGATLAGVLNYRVLDLRRSKMAVLGLARGRCGAIRTTTSNTMFAKLFEVAIFDESVHDSTNFTNLPRPSALGLFLCPCGRCWAYNQLKILIKKRPRRHRRGLWHFVVAQIREDWRHWNGLTS
jgi:hypothetical protein